MREPKPNAEPAARPASCPFCGGNKFETLAKVITVTTFWRCRECEGTWSIASQAASRPQRGAPSSW